ncbi:3319_t:CDS:2 [Acaulospora morrowiae]|uniref:General transcription and DNA repair factor IIH subunit TFB4 n=1 Tax=Acaulospora morrowiae TaxID=94023 RepID=A0A9N9DC41_9GLOM|nr:3319_t:CDS:2 [Acaulospora morrowiae]
MSILKDIVTVNEEDANLLVLIIDTNPVNWGKAASRPTKGSCLPLQEALRHLMVFINAHLALKHDNEVAVIASHFGVSKFLYPIPSSGQTHESSDQSSDSSMFQKFRVVDDQVILNIKELLETEEIPSSYPDKDINRITKADELGHIKSRILIISVSPDSPYQYISIMNCIFSAQKLGIPIDICKVSENDDTVFLQQASHITGGRYLRLPIDQAQGFLQFLMITFLPDRFSRRHMCLPGEEKVDFGAACFCHKRTINIGYVCSVCLSSILLKKFFLSGQAHNIPS